VTNVQAATGFEMLMDANVVSAGSPAETELRMICEVFDL